MKKLAKVLSLSLALAMCAICLTACAATAESVTKKYEKADYKVATLKAEDVAKVIPDVEKGEIEWVVKATKGLTSATVIGFKTKEAAEDAEKLAKALLQKTKLEGKVLTYSLSEDALNAK